MKTIERGTHSMTADIRRKNIRFRTGFPQATTSTHKQGGLRSLCRSAEGCVCPPEMKIDGSASLEIGAGGEGRESRTHHFVLCIQLLLSSALPQLSGASSEQHALARFWHEEQERDHQDGADSVCSPQGIVIDLVECAKGAKPELTDRQTGSHGAPPEDPRPIVAFYNVSARHRRQDDEGLC